jgi:cobalt-zinc-cadmium efflux system membrane fusion protein
MKFRTSKSLRLGLLVLGVIALVALAAAAMPLVGLPPVTDWWKKPPAAADSSASSDSETSAELVPGQNDTVRLASAVVTKLAIRVAEVKELSPSTGLVPPHRPQGTQNFDGWPDAAVAEATSSHVLHLSGWLGLDTNNLAPVRSRFPGEVIQIGTVQERGASLQTVSRPLSYGDRVSKGQLLVVVWNADLGNKKNDLVDAIYALNLDQEILKRAEEHADSVPEVFILNQRQKVQADRNAMSRAESTLRTWRVPEEEIDAVKEEAQRVIERKGKRDPAKQESWPRVEMKAPFDGTILEKTVGLHSYVDTSTDLFKIANLDKLAVYANAYENDLPGLQALKPEQRRWQIRVLNEPHGKPLPGTIDVIGYTIDPNQHTAIVIGRVDNPDERLRVNQQVIAEVALPPAPDEIVIPMSALVEDGREGVVFIQPDPAKPYYRQERVNVARREHEVVFLSKIAKSDDSTGRITGNEALKPGQTWVVTSGAVELKAALEDLQSRAKQQ